MKKGFFGRPYSVVLCIEMIDEERIVRFIVQYVKINCKRQPETEVI